MKRSFFAFLFIAIVTTVAILYVAFFRGKPAPVPVATRPDASSTTTPTSSSAAASPPTRATIADIDGAVTLRSGGSSRPASKGDIVRVGDMIQTGQDGSASVEFFFGARTSLDKNTSVTIDRVEAASNTPEQAPVSLTLTNGRVWSRVLKSATFDPGYEVRYGDITVSAKGTAFLVTGGRTPSQNTSMSIDTFGGTVIVSGATSGDIRAGLSAKFQTKDAPPDVATAMFFTPDTTRNDAWVRRELREDRGFVERTIQAGKQSGTRDAFSDVGNEAGPYTLDQPGAHSDFRAVIVTATNKVARTATAKTVQLKADAVFQAQGANKPTTRDVTNEAKWDISDPARGSIDRNGLLSVNTNATGTIAVIARWNDGTHEQSGAAVIAITPPERRAAPSSTQPILP